MCASMIEKTLVAVFWCVCGASQHIPLALRVRLGVRIAVCARVLFLHATAYAPALFLLVCARA